MSKKAHQKVVVMGAGPAGLSAGYLLTQNHLGTIICEKGQMVGGICQTLEKDGFNFDIGAHRFFTKNEEIKQFIVNLMGKELMEVKRVSKIYCKKRYFDYPLKPLNALLGMGLPIAFHILFDYGLIKTKKVFRKSPAISWEDWLIDSFGKTMYKTYFQSYAEKIYGLTCSQMSSDCGDTRIKGLSLWAAVRDAFFPSNKNKPRSLADKFLYPELGIGRIYDRLAEEIYKQRGNILLDTEVVKMSRSDDQIYSVTVKSPKGLKTIPADEFISSIPITQLVNFLEPSAPPAVLAAARSLRYRHVITVNLILNKKRVMENTWIYLQDPEITAGRMLEPKNWSQKMAPPDKTSLVVDYFCSDGDKLWTADEQKLIELTIKDIGKKLGFFKPAEVIEGFIVRVPKAYPLYVLGYEKHLKVIKEYLKNFKNLQLVGRYGTFKYNNMDHSIEAGLKAAQNILGEKQDLEEINVDKEYQEEIREPKKALRIGGNR